MLWAGSDGGLELRAAADGGRRLRGQFPYNKPAVLSDGGRSGRPQKEVIAPNAFSYRVEKPDEDIHLLVGHSYDKPLASKAAGTLKFNDTPEALIFDAIITPEMTRVSYVEDFLAAFSAGLVAGISPGFRIPPARAVKEAEKVEEEDPRFGTAIIRTVLAALLYELSVVTRPAYPEAQVEARNWNSGRSSEIPEPPDAGLRRAMSRWRA